MDGMASKHTRRRYWLLVLAWLPLVSWAGVGDIRIDLRADRVSVEAHGVTRTEVLQALAERTGAELRLRGDTGSEVRDWLLHEHTVVDAVRRLARPLDVMVLFGEQGRVSRIYLIGGQQPTRTQARGASTPRALPTNGTLRGTDHWQAPPAPDSDTLMRRHEIAGLGIDGNAERLPELSSALSDPDIGVRLEALRALGQVDSDEAIRLVAQVAMGGAAVERRAAIDVLAGSTRPIADMFLSRIRPGRTD